MTNQSLEATSRRARAILKINGTVIPNVERMEYTENNYYVADTFRVTLPLYDKDGKPLAQWLSEAKMLVEIFIGFPEDPLVYTPADLDRLIIGEVDQMNLQIFGSNGGSIEITGRDLSSRLIENRTTQKYPNFTASEIAKKLASENGLKASVVATKTKVGTYYIQDFVQLGATYTEWKLLTYLAQREGYQLYVKDETLYFKPKVVDSSNPYQLNVQPIQEGQSAKFDGTHISLARNLTLAKDVEVKVLTWNSITGKTQATARANKTTTNTDAISRFVYRIPGLTKQQALDRANNLLEEITRHEIVLQFTRPGDNILNKDSVIKLKGMGKEADYSYYPYQIRRTISNSTGYVMTAKAKNHAPQNDVVL